MVLTSNSWGALQHLYTFEDGTANDTQGTAHGVIQDGARVYAGQLALGETAGSATMQHVVLPAADIAINTYSELTFEIWLSPNGAPDNEGFTMAAAFGRHGDPVIDIDAGDSADFGHNYIMIQPTRGGGGPSRVAITDDYFNMETGVEASVLRGTGQRHIAVTFTSTGPDATTINYYLDGALVNSATGDADLADLSNSVAYLGKSVYTLDPYYLGTIDEFRIHDNALSASAVAASAVAGPAGPNGPTVTINRSTGTMTLTNLNDSVDVVSMTVESVSGALDATKWLSITDNYDSDNGGEFDDNDTWATPTAPTDLLWQETEAVGNGGQLGAGETTSLQIGNTGAWRKSIYNDVDVTIQLFDTATSELFNMQADVEYTGTPFQRSDLDFNGSINGADWDVFKLNHLSSALTGLTDATSYALGDLDGDQDNDFTDFRLFQADFDAANGFGAFSAMIASVPEPASLLMGLLGAMALGLRRRSAK
jgi:hypothetical protein